MESGWGQGGRRGELPLKERERKKEETSRFITGIRRRLSTVEPSRDAQTKRKDPGIEWSAPEGTRALAANSREPRLEGQPSVPKLVTPLHRGGSEQECLFYLDYLKAHTEVVGRFKGGIKRGGHRGFLYF